MTKIKWNKILKQTIKKNPNTSLKKILIKSKKKFLNLIKNDIKRQTKKIRKK